jgi:hypothetical protein
LIPCGIRKAATVSLSSSNTDLFLILSLICNQ